MTLLARLFICFLLGAGALPAANHYIRAGASGSNNGTSWANAWPTFAAAAWTRGDTYYVAGGTYSENVTISAALSGSTYIFVKKANAADNSGDPGWSDTYATTLALISGYMAMNVGYIEVEGVTGSGTSGHGIKVFNTDVTPTVIFDIDGDHFHLLHTEVRGAGYSHPTVGYTTLYANTNSGGRKGYHVAHCWIHEASANGILTGPVSGTSYSDYGMLFESNVVSETGGVTDPEQHGQGWQLSTSDYFIIKDSVFRNCVGSGMLAYLGVSGQTFSHQQIYNNLFYITDLTTYTGVSPGVIWMSSAAASADNVLIANCSFYGLGSVAVPGVLAQVMINTPVKTNVVLENCIWENSNFTQGNDVNTQSNNGYFGNTGSVPSGTTNQVDGGATTFASPGSYDFRLKAGGYAIDAGTDLSVTFADDLDGTPRPQGNAFDLGAYELVSGASARARRGATSLAAGF